MIKTDSKPLIEDYHLLAYDEIDSTNDEARRLATGGASHGAVIWAKSQAYGKGRMGREWVSENGNLFVTVLLSPDKPLAEFAELSFVTSLAVLEMLEPIVDNPAMLRLKWPNDILLNEKKIGGILLESFETENESGEKRSWVAVGIGVNVDSYPKENVRFPATCLTESGVQIISAKIVLSRFIHHFLERYDLWMSEGIEPVLEGWKEHAYRLGKKTEVRQGDVMIKGTFTDLRADGAMLLKDESGTMQELLAGDMMPEHILSSESVEA